MYLLLSVELHTSDYPLNPGGRALLTLNPLVLTPNHPTREWETAMIPLFPSPFDSERARGESWVHKKHRTREPYERHA